MNVLVIGSGGREHALAWKASKSSRVTKVYVAPGNAGTDMEHNLENVSLSVSDFVGLADFAESNNVGLTIVGPEQPLVDGVVDYFNTRGLAIFGPSSGAAQLEGSKAFTKDFLEFDGGLEYIWRRLSKGEEVGGSSGCGGDRELLLHDEVVGRRLALHASLALHLGRHVRAHAAQVLRGERRHVLAAQVLGHAHARHLHRALHLEL